MRVLTKARYWKSKELYSISETTFVRAIKAFVADFSKDPVRNRIPNILKDNGLSNKAALIRTLLAKNIIARQIAQDDTITYILGQGNVEQRIRKLYQKLYRPYNGEIPYDRTNPKLDISLSKTVEYMPLNENYGLKWVDAKPLAHLFIEFHYNDLRFNTGQPLCEDYLMESYGVFDDCYKLAKYILKEVIAARERDVQCTYVPIYLPNYSWIRRINVTIKDGNSNTAATYNTGSTIRTCEDGEQRFLPMEISISARLLNNDSEGTSTPIPLIMHELQHAYEDYQRLCNQSMPLRQTVRNNKYSAIKDEIANKDSDVAWIIYYLKRFERNAFLAQMVGEFRETFDDVKTLNGFPAVVDAVKHTQTWLDYHAYIDRMRAIAGCLVKGDQEDYLKAFNRLSTRKFQSFSELRRFLLNAANKLSRKFVDICAKVAYYFWMEYETNGTTSELEHLRESMRVEPTTLTSPIERKINEIALKDALQDRESRLYKTLDNQYIRD